MAEQLSFIPELLSPAGGLEKGKLVVDYGANALYCGLQKFGLRTAADNFTAFELEVMVEYARQKNADVHVVLNSFFHDKDLEELPETLFFLQKIGVKAVIVSDLGAITTIRKTTPGLDIHLSTQASCTSLESALFWRDQGVSRIVLAREVSLREAEAIKRGSNLEIEMFVHGSMCMSYSGHCTISNFTSGRDSNRGGCAHSCRFEYSLKNKEGEKSKAFFMSSKDLNGLAYLKNYRDSGIDSLKIEGRMKGALYAATTTKVYRYALDELSRSGYLSADFLVWAEEELANMSHRDYTEGSLQELAGASSIYNKREHEESDSINIGRVLRAPQNLGAQLCRVEVEVRSAFQVGDELEFIPQKGKNWRAKICQLTDLFQKPVEKSRPGTVAVCHLTLSGGVQAAGDSGMVVRGVQ
jgi:U32 family peptidase